MGVVPPEIPTWMTREELIVYREFLIRTSRSLPFASFGPSSDFLERQREGLTPGTFRRTAFPSEDFQIVLAVLLPWIVAVGLKLWLGDW